MAMSHNRKLRFHCQEPYWNEVFRIGRHPEKFNKGNKPNEPIYEVMTEYHDGLEECDSDVTGWMFREVA